MSMAKNNHSIVHDKDLDPISKVLDSQIFFLFLLEADLINLDLPLPYSWGGNQSKKKP